MTPPVTAAGFESPSLAPPGGGGAAYELKFLLDETRAAAVEQWARQRLALDPHGDPANGGAYQTVSLYCDTPELDVFHRAAVYRRRKFRVRRYGSMAWVFLERKSKWGDRVAKKRTAVPEADLHSLGQSTSVPDWAGHWFHQRVQARRLSPACRIAYQRTAFVGTVPEGPLRLTLDRHVRGILTDDWRPELFQGGLPLMPGQVILEFKFRSALSGPFKQLIGDMGLSPSPVSKYRLCRQAWGLPATAREVADA